MKILVVGGYGIFGGRVVELLESEPRLTLVAAGRSPAKAQAYCARRAAAKARLVAARFDRDDDLAAQLAAIGPDLVVDASRPFQAYGDRPYRLIEACIAQRADYLDLADGSDFVAGVGAFDAAARPLRSRLRSKASGWSTAGSSPAPPPRQRRNRTPPSWRPPW